MAKLTTKARRKLPLGKFALAGREYPIENKRHAALAKSGAAHAHRVGNITTHELQTINAKADRVLNGSGK